ncbi:MAG: hypothetical protein HY590_04520 [Candidatus Omnitrophica bacterium]|nr:hypothetical protein [Candidatus Omnitrophota bacterium]
MSAKNVRTPGLLLLGVSFILLSGRVAFNTPTKQVSKTSTGTASLTTDVLEGAGVFHPLTAEYLRQRSKDLPYSTEESSVSEKPKVFETLSPLELALLPEENVLPKKKKARRLPVGAKEKGTWEPLSEEELKERERELAQKAIEMGVELADSLSMSTFSNGILWTTQRFNAYRHHLADQYRLHFHLSGDDATLSYNVKY